MRAKGTYLIKDVCSGRRNGRFRFLAALGRTPSAVLVFQVLGPRAQVLVFVVVVLCGRGGGLIVGLLVLEEVGRPRAGEFAAETGREGGLVFGWGVRSDVTEVAKDGRTLALFKSGSRGQQQISTAS